MGSYDSQQVWPPFPLFSSQGWYIPDSRRAVTSAVTHKLPWGWKGCSWAWPLPSVSCCCSFSCVVFPLGASLLEMSGGVAMGRMVSRSLVPGFSRIRTGLATLRGTWKTRDIKRSWAQAKVLTGRGCGWVTGSHRKPPPCRARIVSFKNQAKVTDKSIGAKLSLPVRLPGALRCKSEQECPATALSGWDPLRTTVLSPSSTSTTVRKGKHSLAWPTSILPAQVIPNKSRGGWQCQAIGFRGLRTMAPGGDAPVPCPHLSEGEPRPTQPVLLHRGHIPVPSVLTSISPKPSLTCFSILG